jgi:hypothetical protein
MVLTDESDTGASAETRLVELLQRSDADGDRVTLVIGSGLDDHAIPRVADVIDVAKRYAEGRDDEGDLQEALREAERRCAEDSPGALYDHVRRALLDWLSPGEYNAIAQQTVLHRYRPPDLHASPLGSHGMWQPISFRLGAAIERDLESWQIPSSVQALGALLAQRGEMFGHRILTTNIDPLLEIAVRRAGGQARSMVTNGTPNPRAGYDVDAVTVHHLHGFWRPLTPVSTGRITEVIDDRASADIARAAAELMDGDLICVLGASDRIGTIRAAIAEIPEPPTVIWVSHGGGAPDGHADLVHLGPVDNSRALPELAKRLRVAVPTMTVTTARSRHLNWERLFVSQPDNEPPDDIADLLREVGRRFTWRTEWSDTRSPDDRVELVYWPVRLRRRTSVIHMVQAFAAGALAARGARLVIALDDLTGQHRPEVRRSFEADLRRWVAHTAPSAEPSVQSLKQYVDDITTSPTAAALLRPVTPWQVANDLYGGSISLYTVLAAVKALPHLAPYDLEDSAKKIVQDLQRHSSDRLLTPSTTWSFLHYLLLDTPSSAVMTLGGRDEALFWEQWRQIYEFDVSQLYNPLIKSLTHESGMVRWKDREELSGQLRRFRETQQHWEDEGRFIHWLFQNAVLLPLYLNRLEVPRVEGIAIDSWAAFAEGEKEGAPVLEMLAKRATELYLGIPD